MTLHWYAVEVDVPHAGETISYIQASSSQQAGETYPGSTVLGGPYASAAAAEKAYPQGSHGTRAVTPGLPPPTTSDKPVQLPNPLGGLAAIGDFFSRLTEASTWERIGQVALGLLLIAVGVAHLTHAVPLATAVAKKVGGAAAEGAVLA